MKILVTGGTGFIGSHTCHALLAAGHDLTLFVRNKQKAKDMFGTKVKIIVGDISSMSDVKKALKGCDGAIHMAAMVSTSKGDAELVYQTNLSAAENVLGLAVDAGCKTIIHVSSVTAIYDKKATRLTNKSPLGEARNAYARSKVDCERFARGLQDAGAPLHITYPASVIGPDDPGLTEPHAGLVANLYGLGLNMPSGNQYVDVRDVAAAHVALMDEPRKPGRFPLGGNFVTWKDQYATLSRLTGRSLFTIPMPGFSMRLLGRTMDALKPLTGMQSPLTYEAMVYATNWKKMDNTTAEKELGVSFRPYDESLIDTIHWLEQANHITRSQAGLLSRHQ